MDIRSILDTHDRGLTVKESSLNPLQQLKSRQEEIAADLIEKMNQNNPANLAHAFHLMQPPVPYDNTPPQVNAARTDNSALLR